MHPSMKIDVVKGLKMRGLQPRIASQKEIEDYAKYLQDSTYHPYDTIEGFAYKLDKIIEEDDNKDIWL